MKRSILLSLMLIAGVLGAIGFTAAQFTDFERAQTTLTAATLDLEVNGETSGNPILFTCTVLPVGGFDEADTGTCTFDLSNVGSVHGDVYAMIVTTPIACENTAQGGAGGDTEFCDANANLTAENFEVTAASFGGNPAGGTPVELDLAESAGCQPLVPSNNALDAGETKTVSYTLQAEDLTNSMQGDALILTFHIEMVEDGGTAGNCVEDAP